MKRSRFNEKQIIARAEARSRSPLPPAMNQKYSQMLTASLADAKQCHLASR